MANLNMNEPGTWQERRDETAYYKHHMKQLEQERMEELAKKQERFNALPPEQQKNAKESQSQSVTNLNRVKVKKVEIPNEARLVDYANLTGTSIAQWVKMVRDYADAAPEQVNSNFLIPGWMGGMIVETMGIEPIYLTKEEHNVERKQYTQEEYEQLPPRDPIICVMGHVDHGKTTLIDQLRQSNIAEQEAGGITQAIGAFRVALPEGSSRYSQVTLIDTPGHAAFSGMRKRGANCVDCVVLVVDATDQVQPQTKESLAIIRAANVPFVVALNKCDLDSAQPERLKKELVQYGVDPLDTEFVQISALKGQNIDELLSTIDVLCELQDPRADPNALAELVCLESKKTEHGSALNAIILNGSLETRAWLVGGTIFGKVQSVRSQGEVIIPPLKAGPSTPVEIYGFSEMPQTGVDLLEVRSKKEAELIVKNRKREEYERSDKVLPEYELTDDQKRLFTQNARYRRWAKQFSAEEQKEWRSQTFRRVKSDSAEDNRAIHVMIQADTWGAVEALENYVNLIEVPEQEYYIRILEKSVGHLTEQKLQMFDDEKVVFLAYNVLTPKEGSLRFGNMIKGEIIFNVIDDLLKALEEKLTPDAVDTDLGRAECKKIFNTNNKKKQVPIAGSTILEGKLVSKHWWRIERNGVILHEQEGATELRHFKDVVEELGDRKDCGICLDFKFWEEGDEVVCFERTFKNRKIPHPSFLLEGIGEAAN